MLLLPPLSILDFIRNVVDPTCRVSSTLFFPFTMLGSASPGMLRLSTFTRPCFSLDSYKNLTVCTSLNDLRGHLRVRILIQSHELRCRAVERLFLPKPRLQRPLQVAEGAGSCLGFSRGGSWADALCGSSMGYWLLKTEPGEWGWEHQERNGGVSQWDGVRSAQAQGHLRSMRQGDLAFFYHSGKGPAVVGVVEVVRAAYPDSSDDTGKHCMVDVRALAAFPTPVPLAVIKSEDTMRDWILLRQSRLSVMPVSPAVWARVCELGELSPPPWCATASEEDAASNVTDLKRTVKEKKQKARVKDSSEDEPKKRARRLPPKPEIGDGVSRDGREDMNQDKQSTEPELVSVAELKTYTRRKVDIVAPKAYKRRRSRNHNATA